MDAMKNRVIASAWDYHNRTKHSYQSIRNSGHYLDWEIQPLPFKIYSKLEPIALPQHLSSSGVAALSAIAEVQIPARGETRPTMQLLAELFYLSAGVTRRRSYPGGEMLFRAAACTGALYHIDLYLACEDLEELEAGVYHFSPHDFALRRLRRGNFRALLAAASGEEPSIVAAPAVLISASTYWRNAWKYQARAYRHCYWDNGTILANLLAAAATRHLPAKLVMGFVDGTVSKLLSLDGEREAPLSLIALGSVPTQPAAPAPAIEPLAFETVPLSKEEVEYPVMKDMHEASSLQNEEEARMWRLEGGEQSGNRKTDNRARKTESGNNEMLFPLRPLNDDQMPQDTIEDVIVRRGSTRQFARESMTFAQLSTLLDRATRGVAADFLDSPRAWLNDIYLIVHAVDELPPGAYVYRRERQALALLKEGDFRRDAGYLGLGQEIPADCSVNVYFLADLGCVLERFGNRGYRAAQLEASIMGGKLYLAAYAQQLGASGLTFFDDDVTEFFSPDGAGKSVMFLVAVGKSVKKKG